MRTPVSRGGGPAVKLQSTLERFLVRPSTVPRPLTVQASAPPSDATTAVVIGAEARGGGVSLRRRAEFERRASPRRGEVASSASRPTAAPTPRVSCKYYFAGYCKDGDRCRYVHDDGVSGPHHHALLSPREVVAPTSASTTGSPHGTGIASSRVESILPWMPPRHASGDDLSGIAASLLLAAAPHDRPLPRTASTRMPRPLAMRNRVVLPWCHASRATTTTTRATTRVGSGPAAPRTSLAWNSAVSILRQASRHVQEPSDVTDVISSIADAVGGSGAFESGEALEAVLSRFMVPEASQHWVTRVFPWMCEELADAPRWFGHVTSCLPAVDTTTTTYDRPSPSSLVSQLGEHTTWRSTSPAAAASSTSCCSRESFPAGEVPVLKKGEEGSLELTMRQCCVLLIGAFFGIFPDRHFNDTYVYQIVAPPDTPAVEDPSAADDRFVECQMPSFSLFRLMNAGNSNARHKLWCLLEYFSVRYDVACATRQQGTTRPLSDTAVVKYTRCIAAAGHTDVSLFHKASGQAVETAATLAARQSSRHRSLPLPPWRVASHGDTPSIPLCPVVIDDLGVIESMGSALHADFANRVIGGGVLGHGCVQEEIRFVISPELLVSRLFCEDLRADEAILMQGAVTYSTYTGYASSFRYNGKAPSHSLPEFFLARSSLVTGAVDVASRAPPPRTDMVDSHVVAYDAVEFKSMRQGAAAQFEPFWVYREALKAYTAVKGPCEGSFTRDCPYPDRFATGNWGCGAFGGDLHLKFLLQWAATSAGLAHRDTASLGRTKHRPGMTYFTFQVPGLQEELLWLEHAVQSRELRADALFQFILTSAVKHTQVCREFYNTLARDTGDVTRIRRRDTAHKSPSYFHTAAELLSMTPLPVAVELGTTAFTAARVGTYATTTSVATHGTAASAMHSLLDTLDDDGTTSLTRRQPSTSLPRSSSVPTSRSAETGGLVRKRVRSPTTTAADDVFIID